MKELHNSQHSLGHLKWNNFKQRVGWLQGLPALGLILGAHLVTSN